MGDEHLYKFLDSTIPSCKNFKWKEFLWLPKWKIHVLPDEEVFFNLIMTANKMQHIRDILKQPIKITSGYRPKEYNVLIGGATKSAHILGLACDFQVKDIPAKDVREILLPHLEKLDIRMEDHKGNWTHIDLIPVSPKGKRFFKP